MTYISWSSDFVLYLQDYLMHESYFQIMRQFDPNFDLKVNTSEHDLYLFHGLLILLNIFKII